MAHNYRTMNHTDGFVQSFEKRWRSDHPDDDFLNHKMEEACHQELLMRSLEMASCHSQQDSGSSSGELATMVNTSATILPEEQLVGEKYPELKNLFWISVSGYETELAYIVYRFFHDIGPIVAKSCTNRNVMYLKYLTVLDCEIATSYNGQRIGYGGDIRVKVKVENPVIQSPFIEALEQYSQEVAGVTPGEVAIDVEAPEGEEETEVLDEDIASHQLHTGTIADLENGGIKPKKVGVLQWVKQKLSYMFYFY